MNVHSVKTVETYINAHFMKTIKEITFNKYNKNTQLNCKKHNILEKNTKNYFGRRKQLYFKLFRWVFLLLIQFKKV